MLPNNGMMIGKFMPFHKGHEYLIGFASKMVRNKLFVVICPTKTDSIPAMVRYKWMKAHYAKHEMVDIVYYSDSLEFPDYPKDDNDQEFWDIWREGLMKLTDDLWVPRVLFAGENYGARLAKELGMEFIPLERRAIEISGTEIRKWPYGISNWEMLSTEAQQWYLRRINITGPESCGKSTMAKSLAYRLGTVHVPEYGRSYLEGKSQTDWSMEDIEKIAVGREASENALAKQAKAALIVDTDLFVTKLYAELTGEKVPRWIDNRIEKEALEFHYDLHLVLAPDVPWVADPLRGDDGPQMDRWTFHEKIIDHLEMTNQRYVVISGSDFYMREQQVVKETMNLLREFAMAHNYGQESSK